MDVRLRSRRTAHRWQAAASAATAGVLVALALGTAGPAQATTWSAAPTECPAVYVAAEPSAGVVTTAVRACDANGEQDRWIWIWAEGPGGFTEDLSFQPETLSAEYELYGGSITVPVDGIYTIFATDCAVDRSDCAQPIQASHAGSVAPALTTAPVVRFRTGTSMSPYWFPVRVSSQVATTGPFTFWELLKRVDGRPAEYAGTSQTGTGADYTVEPNHTIQFLTRMWRTDPEVPGVATAGPTLSVRKHPRPNSQWTFSAGWRTRDCSACWAGSTRYTGGAGRSASVRVDAYEVALVARRSHHSGAVRVYVDGRYVAKVNLYVSGTTRNRQVVWRMGWASKGTHTIKFVVVGTAGHPYVDIDGLMILG